MKTFSSHATDISWQSSAWKWLMVIRDYEKTSIVLFVWYNSAVYKFNITTNILFQVRRLSFLSVLHTSWKLACQQVGGMCLWNLLSCYNVLIVNCDNKRSNQRLMNIHKISKINDRRENYDFLINISLTCFSINGKFPLLQKISKLVYIS